MSRQAFSVAYAGAARADDHTIDVEALAPALLAFGRLIRESNTEFNGKKATAKVLVVSDFEHKCFNINFEVLLTAYEQIKTLLGTDNARSAKEVLEWLGILGAPALSYLGYLRWKRGRKAEIVDSGPEGTVTVRAEGDRNSVVINQHIYNLSENPRALRATRDAFAPIGADGFETVEIRDADKVIEVISPDATRDIIASCNTELNAADEIEPDVETVTAWLSVYSPVYDAKAPNWRFRHGKDVIYADISETKIAENALERGGALADDAYQVKLEITTQKNKDGKDGKTTYKIVEVIKFIGADPNIQG